MAQQGLSEAFGKIYAQDVWKGGSGPGSLPRNTVQYRAFVEHFLSDNLIESVTDVGCGDWQSSRLIDWGNADYLGIDVVPAVIERNQKLFANERVRFQSSFGPDDLPGGDLVLCKEVLQHLPNSMVLEYIHAFTDRYTFALITNTISPGVANVDISPGDFRALRLDLPPFSVKGAVVLTYLPHILEPFRVWRNATFLICGNRRQ